MGGLHAMLNTLVYKARFQDICARRCDALSPNMQVRRWEAQGGLTERRTRMVEHRASST